MSTAPLTAPPEALIFGKLPAHGDFVSRGDWGLERDDWDIYLSRQLGLGEAQFGEQFGVTHAKSCVWRFIEPPGERSRRWMIGNLRPSFDSAGRAFFILAAIQADLAWWTVSRATTCAQTIDSVLSQALHASWTVDHIEAALHDWIEASDTTGVEEQLVLTREWQAWSSQGCRLERRTDAPPQLLLREPDQPEGFGVFLEDAAATHVGLVRKGNEDAFLRNAALGLWAVADGMGGLDHGALASSTVIDHLARAELEGDARNRAHTVSEAIYEANAELFALAAGRGAQIGSTVAVLLISGDCFVALWAGDSRIYVLRDKMLHLLTHDHSLVQALIDRGELEPEEARGHRLSNIISRAVGIDPTIEVEMSMDEPLVDDIFLLCSDGLHGVVDPAELVTALTADSCQGACEMLIQSALDAGAPDNVTVVVVAVRPGPASCGEQ